MKNAKKLLLLVLSLMMLIGVFAVAAFAEESAEGLTVVYADGTTQTFAAGAAVTGRSDVPTDFIQEVDGIAYKFTVAEGAAWIYSEALPETVTADYYGKTITATVEGEKGTEQVYYTTTVDDVTTYVTKDDLGTYLSKMDYNVKIKMYADHTTSKTTVSGRYSMDTYVGSDGKTYYVAMNARYDLDINGHKLTVTGGKVTCLASAFYVYSTKPGAEYHIEGGTTMFYTNNDDYKFIDGTYYGNTTTQYKNSSLKENKPTGFIIIGENAEPKTNVKGPYGDNLTIYGQSLTGSLYGNTVRIWGGNFVQTGTQAVFSNLTNRTVYFYHATFVLTNPKTAFMYQNTTNRTYNNCTIVYTGEGTIPLFKVLNPTNSSTTDADKHTTYSAQIFNNCNFYNVVPGKQYTYSYTCNYTVKENKKDVIKNTYTGTDIFKANYTNCSFGYSDTATSADLDAADSTVAYLAYIANGKTVTANNANYLMNMQLVEDASKLKTITWPGNEKNYYLASDATVAEDIVEAIPKYQTYLVSYEFAGENNTLFYVETPDIVVSVGEDLCATLVDETVPQKVYYTVETAERKTYFFNAGTYAKEITAILNDVDVAKTVVLYEDLSMSSTYVYTPNASPKALHFDLNGHTWTLTGSNSIGLDISGTIYIYSTASGAEVRVPSAGAFFRTNDRTPSGKTQGIGRAYFGEPDATSSAYGKNLTIYCNIINGDMYQTYAYIYGGTFVQNASSTSKYFLLASRLLDPDGHFQIIKNATFVVTVKGSSPLHWTQNSNNSRTFTNCTFISTAGDYAPLLAPYSSGMNNEVIGTPTFDNCNFYNIIPQRNVQYNRKDGAIGTVTPVYNANCRFGFSNFVPAEASQATEAAALYLIRGAEKKTVTVLDVDYVLDVYTSNTPAIPVTWKNLADEDILEYYEADLAPIAPTHIVEWSDFGRGCTWKNIISFTQEVIKDEAENVTAIDMIAVWESYEAWAFTYLVGGKLFFVNLADCGNTELGVGEKFYELFDKLDNTYVVTLYSDLLLTKGMGMGKLGSVENANKVPIPHYNSMQSGNFTLDLNGKTFRTSSEFAFVDGSNVDSYGEFSGGIFCFETDSSKTFKITSSRPNARFEHNDDCSIFCIGEGGGVHIVIEGENITFDSKGSITNAFEMSINNADITVNGGTYIYRGNTVAFSINGNGNASAAVAPTITNAEIVLTHEKAIAVFGMHRYKRNTDLTVTNTKIHSLYPVKLFEIINNNLASSSPEDGAYNYYLTLDGCTVSGVALANAYSHLDQLTYKGTMFATDANSLLNAYMGTAPEGCIAAYKNDIIGGYEVKLLGYYTTTETALVDWGFGLTEYWAIGQIAKHDITVVDDIFAYAFESVIVKANENESTATLVAIYPGAIQMSLTLQSKIGLNVLLRKEVFKNANVTLGANDAVVLDEAIEGNYYTVSAAIAPNKANEDITLVIEINGNTHTIPVSVGTYAEALLASNPAEKVQNLTYSMIEYVRAMTKDDDFCNVEIPNGYRQLLTAEEYVKAEENAILTGIRFSLAETIAIEVAATAAMEERVNLILAEGRSEWADIEAKVQDEKTVYTAIFEGLYVNEFFGDITIEIGGETYTYNLANYYHAMQGSDEKAVIEALYNYAYHAQEYVDSITPAAN